MAQNQNHRRQKMLLPILIAIPILVALFLLLFNYFLNSCLSAASKNSVLGATSFDVSASKTQILDNETFNYVATITTDATPAINASLAFTLSGEGRMIDPIVINGGTGLCNRTTDLKAVCTDVILMPNQTATVTVPVTSKSNCSQVQPNSLTMVGTLNSVVSNFEDTAIANCVTGSSTSPSPQPAPAPAPQPQPSPSGNGGGNNSGTGSSAGNSGLGGFFIPTSGADITSNLTGDQINKCIQSSLLNTLGALFVLWLLLIIGVILYKKGRESGESKNGNGNGKRK